MQAGRHFTAEVEFHWDASQETLHLTPSSQRLALSIKQDLKSYPLNHWEKTTISQVLSHKIFKILYYHPDVMIEQCVKTNMI